MFRWPISVALFLLWGAAPVVAEETVGCPAFLDHDLPKLHFKDSVNLCELAAGKPMLVVNTAAAVEFHKISVERSGPGSGVFLK